MIFSIHALGCKLNQAESDEIKAELKKLGHVCAPFNDKSDVAIIRACAVTAGASQTTREMIRAAKRRGAYVIASGCLENKDLPEIDFIAETPGDILKQIQLLKFKTKKSINKKIVLADRTRAFIKIQNGCNFNCAYCAIPNYRGRSQSVRSDVIVKKINLASDNGCKEVVLTGVNICQYKHGALDLAKLLREILLNTKIERIRLGSLDPRLITPNLMKLWAKNPRLMPHWHLSLQSGSDTVLARMNRGYDTEKYYSIVKKMRALKKNFSFTTDIIVGFPGETENEFAETCAFVKKVIFSKVHIFPYSVRPNTKAALSKDFVQDKIKTERVKILTRIAEEAAEKFAKKFVGKKREVLFEHKKNGQWFGYTPEYLPVQYKSDENLKNVIKKIIF